VDTPGEEANLRLLTARASAAMQLYRFLFAPVLLAVAVWSGHDQRRPAPAPERPAAVQPRGIPDQFRREPAVRDLTSLAPVMPEHARQGR
jgi:hypothetical protein